MECAMTETKGDGATTTSTDSDNDRPNPVSLHTNDKNPVCSMPIKSSSTIMSTDVEPSEAPNYRALQFPPFGLIKVTVQGQSVPKFGYKAVLLQYCQKASHLFMQIAAEIGGGFHNGSPHEDEYQISVLLVEGPDCAMRKQLTVSNDNDLERLLRPFAEDKTVLDACSVPLILIDFVCSDSLNLTTTRLTDPATRKFHLMVNKNEQLVGSNYAGQCLKDGWQKTFNINDKAERPRKRRRRLSSPAANDQTQTTSYRATEQAAQDKTITDLLEDKAKLSLQVSKLADELEQTTLARNFLRPQKENTATTERYLRYQSRWYSDRFEEAKAMVVTIQKEKKLMEAKSAYLVKKTQHQSNVLKKVESFINALEEKMELLEAKKNIRVADLESELRKALVYVDGLHKYYGVSSTLSTILAQQFCDNLRERERHEAAQLVAAGEDRNNLKRKRSESES